MGYDSRMSVEFRHPDYLASIDFWQTARDVIAGEAAIKSAGVRYMPGLEGMSATEYAAYIGRSMFYNATARTVSGYLGVIFRREPVVKAPDGHGYVAQDVDMLGNGLAAYARSVVSDVFIMGRCGTLVDWSDAEGRAYFSFYRAEDIINWREERIDGRMQLALVVLREVDFVVDDDGFSARPVERYRVLRLEVGSMGQMQSVVELWAWSEDGTAMTLQSSVVPLRRGQALPNIPFIFHGPDFGSATIERSPITDLVATNLDHYRMMTDFKHGMHYTALPTAWVAGFDKESVLRIGSSTAWVTDQTGASAGYLEFTGDGLGTFERALDRNESLLSVLGARLLDSQTSVSESAEALSLRQAGENSVIAGLSIAVSKSLTQALRWLVWWNDAIAHPDEFSAEKVLVELNRDLTVLRLTGKEIQALVLAWQSSAISQDTLLHQFERGDILPAGRSPAEELALIKGNPPPTTSSTSTSTSTTVLDSGQQGFG
jgi:hypothetical protein